MIDPRLVPAIVEVPHRVYGYRLKPYSLIHSLTLEIIGSPFAVGGEPNKEDVARAALICSQAWPDLSRNIPWWIGVVHRNHAREAAAMDVYLRDARTFPELISRGDGGGGDLGVAWQARLAFSLLAERAARDFKSAMMTPINLASWMLAAARENRTGRCQVETEAARRDREELAAMENEPMPQWMQEYLAKHGRRN